MSRFTDLFNLGESRSSCATTQLKELIELVNHARNVPGDIVEIGSYKCGSTIILAAASEICSPHKKVFAFDTFKGAPSISVADSDTIGEFDDVNFSEVKNVTSMIPSIELIQGLHEETIPKFQHRPISFLFLDSDLYTSHLTALHHFWPDISENSPIIFHDFITLNCPGVRKAVDEFFRDFLHQGIKHSFIGGMLVIQK